jgi:molybdopterin-guanine dinucleotide biosynthesis protein A
MGEYRFCTKDLNSRRIDFMDLDVNTKISGYILAGGRSSRMGSDKALLMVQGEPLLQHMKNLIQPFCDQVFISGSNPEYSKFDVPLIPDIFSGCGPIAGLYSSLHYSSTEWNLIISVDVPFVNEELIRLLIANALGCDCVIPRHESGVEPLVAMYNRSCLPVLEEMIKIGNFKLQNLISILDTKYLNCNDLIQKHPRLFHNLNRKEDFLSI